MLIPRTLDIKWNLVRWTVEAMISNFYVVALSYKLIPFYLHTYEYIQKCKALKEYPDNEMRSQLDTTSEISLKWLYSLSVYITDKVQFFFPNPCCTLWIVDAAGHLSTGKKSRDCKLLDVSIFSFQRLLHRDSIAVSWGLFLN